MRKTAKWCIILTAETKKVKYLNAKTIRAAFPATVPVLMGYLAIGMAFGLMLQAIGYNVLWALLMSLLIYAGPDRIWASPCWPWARSCRRWR